MTNEEHATLRSELTRLRTHEVQSELGVVPASVYRLMQLLDSHDSVDDRQTLYTLLLSESSRSKNDSLQIHFLRQRAIDFPRDPLSLSGLAFGLATIQPENTVEAVAFAERALEVAKSQDRQVRYCATNLARIALLLDDYEQLNKAMAELVADADRKREDDQRYEFDFLERVDPKRGDQDLLERYRALRTRR